MKTDTLKFKALFLTLALAYGSQSTLLALPAMDEVQVELLSENEFFELMISRIKKEGVEAVFELLKVLTSKDLLARETYDSVLKRCQDRLDTINALILTPIKTKLAVLKATEPNSRFAQILEKIYKLANELAYKEIDSLLGILKAHKADKDAKKTTALMGKLKKHFAKFTPVAPNMPSAMVTDLEDQIKTIYSLIQAEHLSAVDKLNKDEIATDIKNKFAIIETNFKQASLLSAWSNLLKTI